MGSTTRFYGNLLSLGLLAALITACTPDPGNHGFEIRQIGLRPEARQLSVDFTQNLRLSNAVAEALEHGVPLTISISMELRNQENLTLLADHQAHFEIRYLPLIQHYELSNLSTGEARSYPRLRHVTNALASLHLSFATGPLTPGGYEFRARTWLDRASLPAPMQLPVRFSAHWRHDSDWSTWSFRVSA